MSATDGFGAPIAFGAHHFIVDIPVAPREPVEIIEDFGFNGHETKKEITECRVILARELWSAIRDQARSDFNERLKKKKMQTGAWSTGKNKLDRFLGKELCVLAWAAEHATLDECAIICQKWSALRPEERWWLFAKTAAEAGGDKDTSRGWRKALYCALSDGTSIKVDKKIVPKSRKNKTDEPLPNLFDFIEG
ncbi:MAG: DUF3780 domain-containing protein [Fibrobacter sp.]|nr:DUF3780 domain-containing protein [Fibrobacter sp.]